MFLGFVALEATLAQYIQLANGNAPLEADDAPTFRVYGPSGNVLNGTCGTEADSQTGLHLLTIAATSANSFARGTYSVRIAYAVSAATKVQYYTFTVI